MPLKLATAFSGIGAIEQALKRLDIEHNIVFACDNGDILIDVDSDKELSKIRKMNSILEKREYVHLLYKENSRKTNFVEIAYKGNYTRGTLFYEYVRLVKEIQPEVFIYENVYGVLTHDKGKTWETMQNVFNELGYNFKWQILDARNYGIPQGRRRLFVVGFKNKKYYNKFEFPKSIELNFTMQDFLLDNCAEGNFKYDKNGNIYLLPGGELVTKHLSQKLIDYVMSPGTKKFYHEDAEIDLPIARAILSTQGNTHRASVNNYVTTNGNIRALEPRESLRLMGFPDDFIINVSRAQSYKQSGNSIVVDVLMAIVKEIQKAME